ncbi:MAG: phosphoribosylglycinamide synthetase C domain-containing protein, partial [Dermatophilaceae bacterium]
FGDPETQVVLARLRTPLGGLLRAAADASLRELEPLRWSDDAAVTVVVAAQGYPVAPRTGDVIGGLDGVTGEGTSVCHAGTARADDGTLISAGGRVLSVVSTGGSLAEARARVYRAVARVELAGSHHRRDIAERAERDEVVVPTRA